MRSIPIWASTLFWVLAVGAVLLSVHLLARVRPPPQVDQAYRSIHKQ